MKASNLETTSVSVFGCAKRTKNTVKVKSKAKQSIAMVKFLGVLFVMTYCLAWSCLNFFFFSLLFVKIYILMSVFIVALAIFADSEKILPYWENYETREKIVKGKILFSFIESVKMLAIILLIFGFLHFSGAVKYWEENKDKFPNMVISHYTPNLIETLMFVLIWILSFVVLVTAMLWFSARFIQIRGYSRKTNLLKLKGSKIIIGGTIMALVFWGILGFIDLSFIEVKTGGSFSGAEYLKPIMEPLVPWILIIEIIFLAILSILFWFDGIKMLRKRKDFVVIE